MKMDKVFDVKAFIRLTLRRGKQNKNIEYLEGYLDALWDWDLISNEEQKVLFEYLKKEGQS